MSVMSVIWPLHSKLEYWGVKVYGQALKSHCESQWHAVYAKFCIHYKSVILMVQFPSLFMGQEVCVKTLRFWCVTTRFCPRHLSVVQPHNFHKFPQLSKGIFHQTYRAIIYPWLWPRRRWMCGEKEPEMHSWRISGGMTDEWIEGLHHSFRREERDFDGRFRELCIGMYRVTRLK